MSDAERDGNMLMRRMIASLIAAASLSAAAGAQTLTMAVGSPITSMDPHYHTLTPNIQMSTNIFETLVDMDDKSRPMPGLADSWKVIDDTTWEFHLRDAVFHNGAKVTAEDIAYTLARVPTVVNSPGSFIIYTQGVVGTEIIDSRTIRMKTAKVHPLLPLDLSEVFIIPRTLGALPATEDFNSGKSTIGSGPFRFVSYRSGDRVELVRNDAYWGAKPAWERATVRIIPNDAARTAALLSGDVALIDQVPTADIARLRTDTRMRVWETVSDRIIYMILDQSKPDTTPFVSGPNGEKLTQNPLRDQRVREALSIAINRKLIVDRVMEDGAIASGQFLPPGSYSHAPDLAPPTYDVARAKKLLAEAGFPNGFRITLHSSNDRYLNDAKIVQAIGQMWTRVGIQTVVESLPWASFVGHANKQDYSAALLGWGLSTGEGLNGLRPLVATFDAAKGLGSVNRGRYSNAELDRLIDIASSITDDAKREQAIITATKFAMQDVAIIPLHNQKVTWASQKTLSYVPRADEQTRIALIKPVP